MNGHPQLLMDSEEMMRMGQRRAPVGAGQGFLSLLKRKRGRPGDGIDSDQDDGSNGGRYTGANRMGMFPLMPLGASPGGMRRSRATSPDSRQVNGQLSNRHRTPSMTLKKTKSMTLSCCNSSGNQALNSPDLEYQLMPGEDLSGNLTSSSARQDESTTSDIDPSFMLPPNNNNHEYMNVTQDMVSELQRIRDTSTSEASTSSATTRDPMPLPETPDIRLDPEGSESKEKTNVLKLSSLEPSSGCPCQNPNCGDPSDPSCSPVHIRTPDCTQEPDTPTNRESWIRGTGRSLSPYCLGNGRTHYKYDLLQKSRSCHWDTKCHSTSKSPTTVSASLPLLSHFHEDNLICDVCLSGPDQSPQATITDLPEVHQNLLKSDHHRQNPGDIKSSSLEHFPNVAVLSDGSDRGHHSIADFRCEGSQSAFNTHIILNDSTPHVSLQDNTCEESDQI